MVRLRKTPATVAPVSAASACAGGTDNQAPTIVASAGSEAKLGREAIKGDDANNETRANSAGETCKHAGWAEHPNSTCEPATADPKKYRLLLCRFLDLDRPIVTTRMLAFLRQDGCMAELFRFIVQPHLALREERAAAGDEAGISTTPVPDVTRRAFRSLKMLVDDPRVTEMLRGNLGTLMPVLFEIFECLPQLWSSESREGPSLYHWSALLHTVRCNCSCLDAYSNKPTHHTMRCTDDERQYRGVCQRAGGTRWSGYAVVLASGSTSVRVTRHSGGHCAG